MKSLKKDRISLILAFLILFQLIGPIGVSMAEVMNGSLEMEIEKLETDFLSFRSELIKSLSSEENRLRLEGFEEDLRELKKDIEDFQTDSLADELVGEESVIVEKEEKDELELKFKNLEHEFENLKGEFSFQEDEKRGFAIRLEKALKSIEGPKLDLSNKLDPREEFYLEYSWSLDNDHTYKAGDSLEFDLPEGILIDRISYGKLDSYGEFKIEENGRVTIIFSEKISEESEISGNLFVQAKLDMDKIKVEDNSVVLKDREEEGQVKIPIDKSKWDIVLEKSGEVNKSFNPDSIIWTIKVDNKGLGEAYTIEDFLPEGLSYKEAGMKANGKTIAPKIDGRNLLINLDSSQDSLILNFETSIDEEAWDQKEFTNRAKYVSGDIEKEAKALVTINRGEALKKEALSYDNKTMELGWSIEINGDSKELENTSLEDLWNSDDMELVEGSIKFEALGENADELDYKISLLPEGFKIDLPKISSPYKLTYKTRLKDRLLESKTVSNQVTWNENSSKAKMDISQDVLRKDYSKIDYKNKTIDWKIIINEDGKKMEGLVVEDRFTSLGMDLRPESLKLIYEGKSLKVGDYELIERDDGFNLKLLGKYMEIDSPLEISYSVDFDYLSLREDENIFKNKASISWKDENEKQLSKNVVSELRPNSYTEDNGLKTGSYNAENKEISWDVAVNYRQDGFKELILEDILAGNQRMVPDSIEIYRGEFNGEKLERAELLEKVDLELNSNGFKLNLGETDNPYILSYKTSLEGLNYIEPSYTNDIVVYNLKEKLSTLSSEVVIYYGGRYGQKQGKQNGFFIDWELVVNPSQAELENLKLEDILDGNQEYIEDSIRIFETRVYSNEAFEKSSEYSNYEKEIVKTESGEKLLINFKEKINRPYIVEYSTSYLGQGEAASNSYKLSGKSISDKGISSEEARVEINLSAGGSGQGKLGHLIINKLDTGRKAIGNVRFGLYKEDRLIKMGLTNENGILDFGRLRYGDYILRELEPAEGYLAIDDMEIKIDNETLIDVDGKSTLIKEVINERDPDFKEKTWIEIKKIDSKTKEGLASAGFKILDEDLKEISKELITNEEGLAKLEVETGGIYYILETRAPKGYGLDSSKHRLVVEAGKVNPIEIENILIEELPTETESKEKPVETEEEDIIYYPYFPSEVEKEAEGELDEKSDLDLDDQELEFENELEETGREEEEIFEEEIGSEMANEDGLIKIEVEETGDKEVAKKLPKTGIIDFRFYNIFGLVLLFIASFLFRKN